MGTTNKLRRNRKGTILSVFSTTGITKSTFASNSDEAILEEAVRGEKKAIEDYNEILKETDLPASTKAVLEKHRKKVQAALDHVKTMK